MESEKKKKKKKKKKKNLCLRVFFPDDPLRPDPLCQTPRVVSHPARPSSPTTLSSNSNGTTMSHSWCR